MKKLTDLNPKWTGYLRPDSGECLEFDCPVCRPTHRICARFVNPLDGKDPAMWGDELWTRDGSDFATLTVSPSIDYGRNCFHGWIERGRLFSVKEGPVKVTQLINGVLQIVRLSPLQAIQYGKECIAAGEALLK